jgi:hypothetical protein
MPSTPRSFLVGLALTIAGSACGKTDPTTDLSAIGAFNGAAQGCEPDHTIACTELGGSWSTGDARCRSVSATDPPRWDVSGCALAKPGYLETVKPAERSPGRFAAARCNDGTPFSFTVRLAPGRSSVWAIYLEGGVYCDDDSFSCKVRREQGIDLTRTSVVGDGQLETSSLGGILDPDPAINPDFFAANQVIGHYCSSDFWSGADPNRRPSSADPNGWYYAGHLNVEALLGILIERYGLDDTDPSLRVLFGGASAGAWGAHLNQTRVLGALPKAAAERRIAVLVDAGWMTDWDDVTHRLGAATTRDADVWQRARAFWGGTFDPDCERASVAAGADPSRCFMAPAWYPFVAGRGPTFIQQCSFDSSFTFLHNFQAGDPAATRWTSEVLASFDEAHVGWLFSGKAPSYHFLGMTSTLLGTEPAGETFMEILHAFWTGSPPRQVIF